jgi:hypothetical protein
MANLYEKTWKDAKKAFEKSTGKKKPSNNFLGIFNRTGLTSSVQQLDKAADGDAAGMEKALATFSKNAADYKKTLAAADKKESDDYKAAIAALSKALDKIGKDYQAEIEKKLPAVVKLPDAITRSDDVFRRCKTKLFETKPVAFGVGFTEKSVRISKMIEKEVDGLIQTLILRCSNHVRDLEVEIASTVDGAAAKLEKADEKQQAKIRADTEKACNALIASYRKKVDSEVDKICSDWFSKFKIASAYKRGFVLSWIKGVVGITLSATATALSGGAALAPLMVTIASNGKTMIKLLKSTYEYARSLETAEKKLFELNKELTKLYTEGTRRNIEFTEFQATLGAPWVSGVKDFERVSNEYTKKCVDYEKKGVDPLKKQYRELEKAILAVNKADRKVGKQLSDAYSQVFDAVAAENKILEKRMDLRRKVTDDIKTLKSGREGVLKLYAVFDGATELGSCASAIKNIVTIATKLA